MSDMSHMRRAFILLEQWPKSASVWGVLLRNDRGGDPVVAARSAVDRSFGSRWDESECVFAR